MAAFPPSINTDALDVTIGQIATAIRDTNNRELTLNTYVSGDSIKAMRELASKFSKGEITSDVFQTELAKINDLREEHKEIAASAKENAEKLSARKNALLTLRGALSSYKRSVDGLELRFRQCTFAMVEYDKCVTNVDLALKPFSAEEQKACTWAAEPVIGLFNKFRDSAKYILEPTDQLATTPVASTTAVPAVIPVAVSIAVATPVATSAVETIISDASNTAQATIAEPGKVGQPSKLEYCTNLECWHLAAEHTHE